MSEPQAPRPERGAGAQAQTRPNLGEIVIEIAGNRNRQLLFGPTGQRLRGRWDSHSLAPGDTSQAGLMKMPQIPGMYVTLNARDRVGKVEDPLGFPENRVLAMEVSRIHKGVFNQDVTAVPPLVRDGLMPEDVATWAYWMMRAVNDGQARLLSGRLPEGEEEIIRSVGDGVKVKKLFYDSAESMRQQMRELAGSNIA
jgi:hypothetical protein